MAVQKALMKNRPIVVLAGVVVVFGFGMPILLGVLTRSSSEPGSLKVSEYSGPLLYLLFVSVCFFLLPLWAWFKSKRGVLAAILMFIGLFFIYLIFSYIRSPDTTEDPGMVVFGMFMYVPAFAFIVQLAVYIACKVVSHLRAKHNHA